MDGKFKFYYKKIIFLIFLYFACGIIFNIFLSPIPTSAEPEWKNPVDNLQVKIPNIQTHKAEKCGTDPATGAKIWCIPWIGDYIAGVYKWAIGIVGILAAVILMVAGVLWITSAGNASRVTEAKAWIAAAITGLILALCSYVILFWINPDLVNMSPIKVKVIKKTVSNASADINGCGWLMIPEGKGCKETDVFMLQGQKINKEKLEEKENYCGGIKPANIESQKKNIPTYEFKCCCEMGTQYNNLVQNQMKDASPELNNFLNCIQTKLPKGVGKIDSISDNNYIGNLKECDKLNCNKCPEGVKVNCCQHSCQSCHYGGGTGSGKSYAVDFGDENNAKAFEDASATCGGKFLQEYDPPHIHISVPPCAKK